MSTESARHANGAALALALLAAAGCVHHSISTNLEAVCRGEHVGERIALIVDSVAPSGEPELQRLRGARFDLALTVLSTALTGQCADQMGTASVTVDELPDVLARGASRTRGADWHVQGTAIAINLNPGVADNNLQFLLPLDGGAGHWSLSRLAGPVASGRLLPEPP